MRYLMCLSAGALAIAGAANADFVDVLFTGTGAGENVSVTSPNYSGGVFAGQLNLALTNSSGGPNYGNLNGNWIGFCCELGQYTGGNAQYAVLPVSQVPLSAPMGAVAAAAIGDLFAAAAGAEYTNDSAFAAAFQVAIWEISIDYIGGPIGLGDLSAGAFQASGLSGGAMGYLANLLAAVGATNGANIVGLGNETQQDFIIEIPGPGSVALLGVAGLVGTRRRRA